MGIWRPLSGQIVIFWGNTRSAIHVHVVMFMDTSVFRPSSLRSQSSFPHIYYMNLSLMCRMDTLYLHVVLIS